MHRQDIKQKRGIHSTLYWAGLELLLPLLSGLAAPNNASHSNSQFCFQQIYSVCNFSYLLISPGRSRARVRLRHVPRGSPSVFSPHCLPVIPAAADRGNAKTTDRFRMLSSSASFCGKGNQGQFEEHVECRLRWEVSVSLSRGLTCPALGISKGSNCSSLQLDRLFKVTSATSCILLEPICSFFPA